MNKSTKPTKPRPSRAATAAPKKTRYISINLDGEIAALEKLGFRERWTYLCCKKLANFKTGVVGAFGNQKLTYGDIAGMVKAPATQGRGDGVIDDTQAADFLHRMEAVGLVSNIGRRDNGGLRFELPLSPIGKKAAPSTVDTAGDILDIFPDDAASQTAENPALPRPSDVSDGEVSVMINKKININTDGRGPSADGADPHRAHGAAPLEGFCAGSAAAAALLTADRIREAVADNFNFRGADEPQAVSFYESWAHAGITLDELHAAMTSVEEAADCPDPSPNDLHRRLWPLVVDRSIGRLAA